MTNTPHILHPKTLFALFCLLVGQMHPVAAQKSTQRTRDRGILVITLGTDTTFIHDFEIRGDSFFSKILALPQGLRLTEGRGTFFPNGS